MNKKIITRLIVGVVSCVLLFYGYIIYKALSLKPDEGPYFVTSNEENKGTNSEGSPQIMVEGFISNTEALKKAKEDLKNRPEFKGKSIIIRGSIEFEDNWEISLAIQDPDNKENVDEYNYKAGEWTKGDPVEIRTDQFEKGEYTPLDKINFELVPKILEETKKTTEGIEDLDKIDSVSFTNMGDYLSYNGDPPKRIQYFEVTTHGPRGNTQYRYDLEGKFTKKL